MNSAPQCGVVYCCSWFGVLLFFKKGEQKKCAVRRAGAHIGGGGGGSLLTLGTNPTVMVLAPPCVKVRSSACASLPLASAGAAAAALRALPLPLLPPAGRGRSCDGAAVSASTIMLAGGGCCREAKVLDACSCGGRAGREGSTSPLRPPLGHQLVQIACSRARHADTSSSRALRSADSSESCAESISLESRVSARAGGGGGE